MSSKEATRQQRILVAMHNFLKGRVMGAGGTLRAVIQSDSTTKQSKDLAYRILNSDDWRALVASLQYRVNLDGTTSKMKFWRGKKSYNTARELIESSLDD